MSPSSPPRPIAASWTDSTTPRRSTSASRPGAAASARGEARERTLGGVYAFTAYLLWGFLPLYFLLLAPTGPWEIVAWRIMLSLGFCALLLTVTRTWPRLGAIMRQPRCWRLTALAGAADLRQLAGLHHRGPHGSRDRDEPRLLHQSDRDGASRRCSCCTSGCASTQWVALGIAAARGARHHHRLRRVPVDRAHPRGILRRLRPREEEGRAVGRRRERAHTRDAVAGADRDGACSSSWASRQGLTMGANGCGHAVLLGLAGVVTAIPLLLFAAGARRVSADGDRHAAVRGADPAVHHRRVVAPRADAARALDRLRPGVGGAHRADGGLAADARRTRAGADAGVRDVLASTPRNRGSAPKPGRCPRSRRDPGSARERGSVSAHEAGDGLRGLGDLRVGLRAAEASRHPPRSAAGGRRAAPARRPRARSSGR